MSMDATSLRLWRENYKLSREELARELETTSVTVWRWEKGERRIPPFLQLALVQIQSKIIQINSDRAIIDWLSGGFNEYHYVNESPGFGLKFSVKYIGNENQKKLFGVQVFNGFTPGLTALKKHFATERTGISSMIFLVFSDQGSFDSYTDKDGFRNFSSDDICVIAGYIDNDKFIAVDETPSSIFFRNYNA